MRCPHLRCWNSKHRNIFISARIQLQNFITPREMQYKRPEQYFIYFAIIYNGLRHNIHGNLSRVRMIWNWSNVFGIVLQISRVKVSYSIVGTFVTMNQTLTSLKQAGQCDRFDKIIVKWILQCYCWHYTNKDIDRKLWWQNELNLWGYSYTILIRDMLQLSI